MGSLFYLWGIETWVLQFSSGYDTIVKEGGYMEIKIVEIIQTHYKDATDYPVSYGQRYCEVCGSELDTCFRCMKCRRHHHPMRSKRVVVDNMLAIMERDRWGLDSGG